MPLGDTMAEWSKALVLGTSLRAWVRIPLVSLLLGRLGDPNHTIPTSTTMAQRLSSLSHDVSQN